jgi:Flp pilus assembly pilin Flp
MRLRAALRRLAVAWRWRDQSGQAMAEYAIVVAAVMGGLTVMTFSLIPDFIDALQRYYDSYYMMLSLPVP